MEKIMCHFSTNKILDISSLNLLIRNILIFLLIFVFLSCSLDDPIAPEQDGGLKFVGVYDLSVPEPSGLTFSNDRSSLWTVSDNTNHAYELSLTGQILHELNYTGQDLEGIAYDSTDQTLWLVEELLREVVHIDLSGRELDRNSVDLPGFGNSGLEGICLDPQQKKYLLNEKVPALWAKLNYDFTVSLQKEITDVIDLSGITWDSNRNMFWIVSDQSKMLFLWDPELGTITSYDLDFDKAEGVAFDPMQNRIYIVSDATGKLYVYDITDKN